MGKGRALRERGMEWEGKGDGNRKWAGTRREWGGQRAGEGNGQVKGREK